MLYQVVSKKECLKNLKFLNSIMVPAPQFREEVLKSLQKVFGYEQSVFFLIDNDGNMIDPISYNIDDYYNRIYCDYYFKTDIFNPQKIKETAIEKNVITVTDLLPISKFKTTKYYKDFLREINVFHETAVFLLDGIDLIGVISLFRPYKENEFSSLDIKRLKKISTFVSKILVNYLLLEDTMYKKNILEAYSNISPIGLIIFDKKFNIHFLNDLSKDICNEFFRGEKTFSAQRFIKNLVINDSHWMSGFCKTILSPALNRYTIHIQPAIYFNYSYNEIFMVCIFPEHLSSFKNSPMDAELLKKYSLTKREIEIVELLFAGMSNKEIAKKLYISIHTVKTHMQNIFKKMNVTHRTGLIYKINLLNEERNKLYIKR